MSGVPIGGTVAAGFEAVRETFAANFTERGELGASCTVVRDGERVVDLWGGYTSKDRLTPWERDTLVLVFSLSKGISGLAAAVQNSKGLLDYDALVTKYWPEFGCNGKEHVTVRQLLSEQAGLAAIDTPLSPEAMADPVHLASVLGGQTPEWVPGDYAGNHAYTIGWIASELIRRTDPQGRTLGAFFADEIAAPLGTDFFLGLPDNIERSRMARIDGWSPLALLFHLRTMPWRMVVAMMWPWSLTHKVMNNPSMLLAGPAGIDTPAYWPMEDGGAGGIGNARSIATIYGEFATGGPTLGLSANTLSNLEQPAPTPNKGIWDQVIKTDLEYSLGLEKPFAADQFGSDGRAYGTFAVGGGFAFADPAERLGYAYVTNKMGFYKWADPREKAMRTSIYEALKHPR